MTKTASDAPVWFVTGCSTGLGREFARAALAHGFRVVATARDPQSIADLVKGKEGQAIALKLDVADPDAIAAAVQGSRARLRPHRRADQQRRLRLHGGGRGGRGRGDPRPVRDQFLRPGGDDPRRPAGHAQASQRRDRQHLLGRRPARLGGRRLLLRHQARGERPVGIAGAGSRAARHSRDDRRARPVPHRLGRPLAAARAGEHRRLRGDGAQARPRDRRLQWLAGGRSGRARPKR